MIQHTIRTKFDIVPAKSALESVPREELEISSIYVPKWLGQFISEEELSAGAAAFLAQALAARTFIEEYPDITKSDRKRMLKRLADFNKLLGDRKKLLKLLSK